MKHIKQWARLSRVVGQFPSLEVFKAQLDRPWTTWFQLGAEPDLREGLEQRSPEVTSNVNDPVILWFCNWHSFNTPLKMRMSIDAHCGRVANFTKNCGGKQLTAEWKTQPEPVLTGSSCWLWGSLLAREMRCAERKRVLLLLGEGLSEQGIQI